MVETHDLPAELSCPWCERRMDSATEISDLGPPTPKRSLSVCAYCSYLAIFDEDEDGRLYLRHCTEEELADIERDAAAQFDLAKALWVTRRLQAQNN